MDILLEGDVTSLLPGMTAQCKIIHQEFDEVTFVPLEAVFQEEEGPVVYRPGGKSQSVILGPVGEDDVVIESGVDPGETLLLIRPGDKGYVVGYCTDNPHGNRNTEFWVAGFSLEGSYSIHRHKAVCMFVAVGIIAPKRRLRPTRQRTGPFDANILNQSFRMLFEVPLKLRHRDLTFSSTSRHSTAYAGK